MSIICDQILKGLLKLYTIFSIHTHREIFVSELGMFDKRFSFTPQQHIDSALLVRFAFNVYILVYTCK